MRGYKQMRATFRSLWKVSAIVAHVQHDRIKLLLLFCNIYNCNMGILTPISEHRRRRTESGGHLTNAARARFYQLDADACILVHTVDLSAQNDHFTHKRRSQQFFVLFFHVVLMMLF